MRVHVCTRGMHIYFVSPRISIIPTEAWRYGEYSHFHTQNIARNRLRRKETEREIATRVVFDPKNANADRRVDLFLVAPSLPMSREGTC